MKNAMNKIKPKYDVNINTNKEYLRSSYQISNDYEIAARYNVKMYSKIQKTIKRLIMKIL